jgi:hypothetical protein
MKWRLLLIVLLIVEVVFALSFYSTNQEKIEFFVTLCALVATLIGLLINISKNKNSSTKAYKKRV